MADENVYKRYLEGLLESSTSSSTSSSSAGPTEWPANPQQDLEIRRKILLKLQREKAQRSGQQTAASRETNIVRGQAQEQRAGAEHPEHRQPSSSTSQSDRETNIVRGPAQEQRAGAEHPEHRQPSSSTSQSGSRPTEKKTSLTFLEESFRHRAESAAATTEARNQQKIHPRSGFQPSVFSTPYRPHSQKTSFVTPFEASSLMRSLGPSTQAQPVQGMDIPEEEQLDRADVPQPAPPATAVPSTSLASQKSPHRTGEIEPRTAYPDSRSSTSEESEDDNAGQQRPLPDRQASSRRGQTASQREEGKTAENNRQQQDDRLRPGDERESASTSQRMPGRGRAPPSFRAPGRTQRKRTPQTTRQGRELKLLIEIRRLQEHTGLLIPKLPFSRLVREITMEIVGLEGHRYTKEAIFAVQTAAEYFITEVFSDAVMVANHAKRVTVMPKDLQLLKRLGKIN